MQEKSGFYMMTSNNQLSGWTKKKPQSTSQSQTYTRKRSQSLFGGLLPAWPTTAFWILAKPLPLRVCLANRWDALKITPATSIGQQKGPILLHDNNQLHITQPALQKLSELGYKVSLIHQMHLTSHQPTTFSSISTTFCRENASTTSRMQKMLSKS